MYEGFVPVQLESNDVHSDVMSGSRQCSELARARAEKRMALRRVWESCIVDGLKKKKARSKGDIELMKVKT